MNIKTHIQMHATRMVRRVPSPHPLLFLPKTGVSSALKSNASAATLPIAHNVMNAIQPFLLQFKMESVHVILDMEKYLHYQQDAPLAIPFIQIA
jgi:hypothetical protein